MHVCVQLPTLLHLTALYHLVSNHVMKVCIVSKYQ
jgi:hypothetical protein